MPSTVPGAWQLTIVQDAAGYRFSLEAFLLADFVPADASGPCLDLGTGCGIIALLLARRFPHLHTVGLELQWPLLAAARHNVVHNRVQQQIDILQADARQVHNLLPAATFGTVICNPPYRVAGSGRLNPDPVKAIARHELTLTLEQLLQACQHVLRPRGLVCMIHHASRLAELCHGLSQAALRPRRLRLVHSTSQTPASMLLVEAVRGGRQTLTIMPPLIVYDGQGGYTAEMQAIFQGRGLG